MQLMHFSAMVGTWQWLHNISYYYNFYYIIPIRSIELSFLFAVYFLILSENYLLKNVFY